MFQQTQLGGMIRFASDTEKCTNHDSLWRGSCEKSKDWHSHPKTRRTQCQKVDAGHSDDAHWLPQGHERQKRIGFWSQNNRTCVLRPPSPPNIFLRQNHEKFPAQSPKLLLTAIPSYLHSSSFALRYPEGLLPVSAQLVESTLANSITAQWASASAITKMLPQRRSPRG